MFIQLTAESGESINEVCIKAIRIAVHLDINVEVRWDLHCVLVATPTMTADAMLSQWYNYLKS